MSLFSVFNKNEKNINRSYIKNLLDVAGADGKLDDDELQLIIAIAGKFDITKEEVITIKNNPQKIDFAPPSSYSAKVRFLEDLVKVMIADKRIDEKEIQICKELAVRLKLSSVVVDDLITSILNSSQ